MNDCFRRAIGADDCARLNESYLMMMANDNGEVKLDPTVPVWKVQCSVVDRSISGNHYKPRKKRKKSTAA